MKKISLIIIALIAIISCTKEHAQDYLTFQGTLENNTDSILTINGIGFNKKIKINPDGSFKDTMRITKPQIFPMTSNSGKRAFVHLANGYDLTLEGDIENYIESFKFSGAGSESNNLYIKHVLFNQNKRNLVNYFSLEKEDFKNKVTSMKKELESIYSKYEDADPTLLNNFKKQSTQILNYLEKGYERMHPSNEGNEVEDDGEGEGEGEYEEEPITNKTGERISSPKFENYENYKGGTTSLDDLKGKFVYIDLWATWCGPCIREIPSLQKLETAYHGKNIEFVSISTDNDRRSGGSWEKANEKWKTFVAKKELTGIQLWAGKDNKFLRDYQVNGIPRFILLDPEGKIVNSNAPRPSNPQIKKLFTELGV